MDYGQSITICALEGSINIDNIADGYSVSAAGGICKEVNETILDPDACGEKDCTNELDCDALRLHPLVNQPCITINKSNGAGQLNNGSYQAVIAYSENGIKLTDYGMFCVKAWHIMYSRNYLRRDIPQKEIRCI